MSRAPAIILAGGGSTRLGRPKQLELLAGECLLDRAVRIVREAGLEPFVVLGCAAERIQAECALEDTRVIPNPDWAGGMASSVRAGVAALDAGVLGVMLLTCDQPAVTADHLRALLQIGQHGECPVASAYDGRLGVPAWFPASHFSFLMALQGDAGARALLLHAASIDLPRGEVDIDTEDDLHRSKKIFSGVRTRDGSS